jgi:hypothetical protein
MFAFLRFSFPNALGNRLATSYPVATARRTCSPVKPRVSAMASETATMAGPGCTKDEGMKSLISAPWPAIALANTASMREALSFVPTIVAAADDAVW